MAKLELNISNFTTNLGKAQSAATAATKKFDSISKVGAGLSKVGSTITKGVTVPLVGLGTAAVKTAADFDAQMSKVKAISGATGDDMVKLRDKAKEMGAKTKFSATEAGEAMEYMGMAGWSAKDMVDGLEGIMNLAAASGEDLASTSDIVTDALTAFGLSAKDSGRFADILAKTSTKTNTNVSMLGESFKYCAPLCGTLGWSAEDCATALGVMANSGIKASQAGTTLRSAMQYLAKPTDEQAALMKKLGFSMTDSNGNMKDMNTVINELRGKFQGLTKQQQVAYASTLFGKQAMSGMLAVLNTSQEEYDALSESIKGCNGTAEEMANTMLDNLNGQLTIIKSSIEGLAIKIGEILMPSIRNFAQGLQNVLDKLNAMSPAQQQAVVKFGLIAAAIGPAILALGKFVTAGANIMKVVSYVKNFSSALTVLGSVGLGPLLAIAAAIAAVGVAFKHFWDTNEGFRNAMIKAWNQVKQSVSSAMTSIKNSVSKLFDALKKLWNTLKPAVEAFMKFVCARLTVMLGFIMGVINGIIQALSPLIDAVTNVVDAITGIIKGFVALFKGDMDGAKKHFSNVWNSVKSIFSNVWKAICNLLSGFCDTMVGYVDAALNLIGTDWESVKGVITNVLNAIKTFFINCWNGIKSFFDTICNALKTAWQAVCDFFGPIMQGVADAFMAAWNGVCSFFSTIATFFTNLWTNIKSIFSDGVSATTETVGGWWDSIKSFVQGIVDGVVNLFNTLWNNVKGIFEGIKQYFTAVWDVIKNIFLGVVLAIIDLVTGDFNALKNDIKKIFDNIKNAFKSAWDAIKKIFTNAINAVKTCVKTGFNVVKTTITTVLNAIKTVVKTVWNAIKTTITTVVNAIKSAITTAFNAIKSTVTSVFNAIKSTAKNVWNGIKSTISNACKSIKSTITNVFNGIKNFISKILNSIKDMFKNVFGSLPGVIKNAASGVTSAVKSMGQSALNALKGLPGQAVKWGKDFVNGFKDGINSAKNAVVGAAKGVADKIRGLLHFSRPDYGPLRDYETWMPDFMEGMAKGLKASMPVLAKQAKQVASMLYQSLSSDSMDLAVAGAYGSYARSAARTARESAKRIQERASESSSSIVIEQIVVRNDNDLKEITRGLYDNNGNALRAKGRRKG